MFDLTLHSVVSSIGTDLEKGPASLDTLVAGVEGTDGLTGERARWYVQQVLDALVKAGEIVKGKRSPWYALKRKV